MIDFSNKIIKFAELLSIEKGFDLINSKLTNVFAEGSAYTVKIKTGTKFYVIIIGSSITYRIDKQLESVYDFYRNYVGSVNKLMVQTKEAIKGYEKYRGLKVNFKPRVVIDSGKKNVASKGYVGKIF